MIYKSESINELAAALSNLQGEMHDVYKSSKGYGYDYADLSAVFESVRPLLKKHGLSVSQPVGGSNNMIELNTILMHSSGQYISSIVGIPVDMANKKMNSLQAAGSTITYMRRYCICSILGLATTDDDGKIGGEELDNRRTSQGTNVTPPPTRHSVAQVSSLQPIEKIADYIGEDQLRMVREELMDMIIEAHIPLETVEKWCSKAGVKSVMEFDFSQAVGCMEYIRKQQQKEAEASDLSKLPTDKGH